jgi:DNA-binding transcriptional regulator YiaG
MEPIEYTQALALITEAQQAGRSRIQALREHRAISQEDFASLTGIPIARVRGEEVGRFELSKDELETVAVLLGISPTLLFP